MRLFLLKTVTKDSRGRCREQGQPHCETIIKVFITSEPTSFNLLELPKLGEPFERKPVPPKTERGDGLVAGDWAAFNFPIRTLLQ